MGSAGSKHKTRPKSAEPGVTSAGAKAKGPSEAARRPRQSQSNPQLGKRPSKDPAKKDPAAGKTNQPGQKRSPKRDTSQPPSPGPADEKAVGDRGAEKVDPIKASEPAKEAAAKTEEGATMAGNKQPVRTMSMEPKDIMISYSHQDKDQMRQIRDCLEHAGITVWVDEVGLKAGVEFFNKIGQAIVDAKLFFCLLSTKSVVSRYCRDELALAYVSSKPIFPCAIEDRDGIIALMDFGMRLQLAPVEWTMFTNEATFNQSMMELVKRIQAKLAELDANKKAPSARKNRPKFERQRSKINLHSTPAFTSKKTEDFWANNFKGQTSVEWETFEVAFKEAYQSDLDGLFKKDDQHWLFTVLSNELDEDADGLVTKLHYDEFCTVDGEMFDFWKRVQEQALESYTMREVFSMNSTVRIDAIQNLSKFHSNSVLEALLDLCNDQDENVRAVAALSLARVATPQNKHAVNRMMTLLKDKDRLVRESGCLALGHIKAEEAAPLLVNLWRNDAISNVREAAQIALEKIGGEEAKKAMHITKVLSEEIKKLAEKP